MQPYQLSPQAQSYYDQARYAGNSSIEHTVEDALAQARTEDDFWEQNHRTLQDLVDLAREYQEMARHYQARG